MKTYTKRSANRLLKRDKKSNHYTIPFAAKRAGQIKNVKLAQAYNRRTHVQTSAFSIIIIN